MFLCSSRALCVWSVSPRAGPGRGEEGGDDRRDDFIPYWSQMTAAHNAAAVAECTTKAQVLTIAMPERIARREGRDAIMARNQIGGGLRRCEPRHAAKGAERPICKALRVCRVGLEVCTPSDSIPVHE